ncbi:hypothetical protein CBR_g34669 [Chara braunii]|uniref:Core Histone H2A/H2B/H3 domain-containing protein n=1 Tax=Chara braunii TaxID=69332 RepID=A0A388JYT4_CHABU|nr:hypothetical protein CBR_g34669 [Chara braunii]|eukprot:GBG62969.1 hypothetical protein CBR_g34669 [Chara braunii]
MLQRARDEGIQVPSDLEEGLAIAPVEGRQDRHQVPHLTQTRLDEWVQHPIQYDLDMAYIRFFVGCGVPFNIARLELYVALHDAYLSQFRGPYRPRQPQYEFLRTTLLSMLYAELNERLRYHRESWSGGVTFMTDGWSTQANRPLCNYLVAGRLGASLYRVEDMFGKGGPGQGASHRVLWDIAMRCLGARTTASPCERNWSTHDFVHTKRRNRLGVEQLEKLVLCHWNIKLLKSSHAREGFIGAGFSGVGLTDVERRAEDFARYEPDEMDPGMYDPTEIEREADRLRRQPRGRRLARAATALAHQIRHQGGEAVQGEDVIDDDVSWLTEPYRGDGFLERAAPVTVSPAGRVLPPRAADDCSGVLAATLAPEAESHSLPVDDADDILGGTDADDASAGGNRAARAACGSARAGEAGTPGAVGAGQASPARHMHDLPSLSARPSASGAVGCSVAQGDTTGPSHTAMSQSPRKMKKCASKPPSGKTAAGKKKKSPKPVPATDDTADARSQPHRRRRRPEMATLAEIRKLQRSTDLCLAFRPFLRIVREVVEETIAPGEGMRFQMTAVSALMEAAEAYLVSNFENTNEVAIHSKRVTIQVKDMRLVDRLSKPRRVEKYEGMLGERARAEERQRRMEARQEETDGSRAGAKKRRAVPPEGIHYNGDIEFSLLKERVPSYFAVSVDMRSTIMANDEGCVKARMLLQRFRESPCIRVDNEVEHSPYSLKGVVQWMCNEGTCEDGDVDMTMHKKGGTYAPADFKKLLGTVAKNSDMLVDGSKDELKTGAAEILVLSRIKNITQTAPQDFQDVPVIVADGVEYVLLDQLCDFMKKSDEDRNVIHEALHEVTEFALQRKDLIEFVPARGEDDFISSSSLWGDLLSRIADTEEVLLADIFNANIMERDQCDVGFEDADLASCFAIYTDNEDIEEDEEEDEEASSSDVEVGASDVSSDEADEEDDVYYDLKGASGQMSKGWTHAVLRLARAFPDPHNVLRVVMKGATPDGALHYAAVTTIMQACNKGKKWSRIGNGWFVLVNREAVLATLLAWGINLSCLIHGKMDSGPRVCDCGRPFMSLRTLNSHRARACPAVVDERAQGQEMDVADACGSSNIGAVNLVSDESEDIGAPENADGEGRSFAEQQPPPAESFDSSRKLAALIFYARVGVGMSQSDIDALLSLLKDPRFSTTDIAYRNSRECLTWAGSLAEAAGWKESDLRGDDWPRDAHAIL